MYQNYTDTNSNSGNADTNCNNGNTATNYNSGNNQCGRKQGRMIAIWGVVYIKDIGGTYL